ncbi:MAG: hypothetical protein H6747_14960 [Deltaproteobacteria bacterium]|nr:hypothetical protein [Deltaproteobacteria bacterium]
MDKARFLGIANVAKLLVVAALATAAACVPPKPPPPRPSEAEVQKRLAEREAKAEERARPTRSSPHAARTDGLEGGSKVFTDDFERSELGSDWQVAHAGEWDIEAGRLRANKVEVYGDRNKGVWLLRRLPEKVRVEFDAEVISAKGDVKCEVFGEKPAHETGYSLIFGGWNNTINTIARKGEHEPERVVQVPHTPVQSRKRYHWAIVRNDDVVRWYVDGAFFLAYDDPKPVKGSFFGFNNWLSDIRFDNLEVFDLAAEAAAEPGAASR